LKSFELNGIFAEMPLQICNLLKMVQWCAIRVSDSRTTLIEALRATIWWFANRAAALKNRADHCRRVVGG